MKLAIIALGKLKEKHYREACSEYCKRLSTMRALDIIELHEELISDESDPSLVAKSLEREAKQIISALRPDDLPVALSMRGQMIDSLSFANMIEPISNPDTKRMAFIIGSSHGLAPAVYASCSVQLSFGPMTFPHQLARIMLLEQIYRAEMINRGRRYHK